ncbi:MAG TPA: hypothetical protein PLS71_25115, partial [Leptospiraceae bacterium]|nr:hypothetical protein [Leptospiraceae bacterium]
YTLIQSIRRIANSYNKNLIIVMTSADESEEIEETSRKIGADFFMKKPIAFDELFQKLKNAIAESEKL